VVVANSENKSDESVWLQFNMPNSKSIKKFTYKWSTIDSAAHEANDENRYCAFIHTASEAFLSLCMLESPSDIVLLEPPLLLSRRINKKREAAALSLFDWIIRRVICISRAYLTGL